MLKVVEMDGSTTNQSWLAVIFCTVRDTRERKHNSSVTLWLRLENGKPIPFGKRLHNYGKSPYFSWEKSLFQWWFSIVILNYQRVIIPYYNPTTIPWSHSLKSVTCGSGSKTATPCAFSTLRCHIWQPFDGSLLSSAGSKQAGGRTVAGTRDWVMTESLGADTLW